MGRPVDLDPNWWEVLRQLSRELTTTKDGPLVPAIHVDVHAHGCLGLCFRFYLSCHLLETKVLVAPKSQPVEVPIQCPIERISEQRVVLFLKRITHNLVRSRPVEEDELLEYSVSLFFV